MWTDWSRMRIEIELPGNQFHDIKGEDIGTFASWNYAVGDLAVKSRKRVQRKSTIVRWLKIFHIIDKFSTGKESRIY